jgi:glycosyltransferase involved in cell wall biosynthesis
MDGLCKFTMPNEEDALFMSSSNDRDPALSLVGRNVVVASRIYLPEPGAASLRLAALSRALRNNGANVTVVTSAPPGGYAQPVADHVDIQVRRARVLRDRLGYVRGYVQYMSFDVPLFFRLLMIRNIDAIVVEPPPTTGLVVRVLCALRRIPYIYYAADLWADAVESTSSPRVVVRVVRALESFSLRGAAAVLSVSAPVTERLIELEPGLSPVTIGNGVDTTVFAPHGSRQEAEPPYLLYAGTASEVHGATVFMDAFQRVREQIPTARIVFVGQGAERDVLKAAAKPFPEGAVTFVSRVPPEEAARWIRGARATLASVRPGAYTIGFPTKILASIACGIPVIYAGEGIGRDFANENNIGWAVEYSAHQVADAMIKALAGDFLELHGDRLAALARDEISLSAVASRASDTVASAFQQSREGSVS